MSLGACHDENKFTILNLNVSLDATSCPASSDYIMTSKAGSSTGFSYYLNFSTCSIDAFKSVLLTPNLK